MNNKEWRKCQLPWEMRLEIKSRAPKHFDAQDAIKDSPIALSCCWPGPDKTLPENGMCVGSPPECWPLHCDILRMAYPDIEEVRDDPYAPLVEFLDKKMDEQIALHTPDCSGPGPECKCIKPPLGVIWPKPEPIKPIEMTVSCDTAPAIASLKKLETEVRAATDRYNRAKAREKFIDTAIRLLAIFFVLSPILWLALNGLLGPSGLVHITYWQVVSAVVIVTLLAGFFRDKQ